jgi:hypothetical protein
MGLVAEIARRRFESQRLSRTTFTKPAEVVAWLGALQAQDYLGALWAVGLRLADACEADVERALAERTIVRTWPMRGTLHFVAAADARWITELLAPRVVAAGASRLAAAGIDGAVLTKARRALVRKLEGGRRLTRPAAYRVLEDAKIATGDSRGLHLLWQLAHDGVLCFGPREGKQQTFVLFEEWLPGAKRLDREEALAELARRYFTGHGPATIADFAWWSGLTRADGSRAVLLAGKGLEEEKIDGQRYWFAPSGKARGGSRREAVAHVLPAFDELLVGYADRSASIDATDAKRVAGGGIFASILVVDGRVVGTWKRRIARHRVVLSTAPFAKPSVSRARAIDLAMRRYARFLGLAIEDDRAVENDRWRV